MTLSFPDHRLVIDALLQAALCAAEPAGAVRRFLHPTDFSQAERVYLVGAGKAGVSMAQAAATRLGNRLTAGILSVPALPDKALERVRFLAGGHPLPNAGSLAAGEAIERLLVQTTGRDLVIALISGGGSALMELPLPGVSLEDLQAVNQILLQRGADIRELNAIRAGLSRIKGGGLAVLAHPARVLGLILSDVIGNPVEIIASGPTATRKGSGDAIHAILRKHRLEKVFPPAVLRVLAAPAVEPDPQPGCVENRIIGSNRLACDAVIETAQEAGYACAFLGDAWQGEARAAGAAFAGEVLRRSGSAPACVVAGGETTVTVRGPGRGGRNQEAALAAAMTLEGKPDIAVAMFATDGVDGPTDAAGAIATGDTVRRARKLNLDPQRHLDGNDAYPFFDRLGGLIRTGPTGTNVNDLWIGLAF